MQLHGYTGGMMRMADQWNEVGRSLRDAETPGRDDLDAYDEYRQTFSAPLDSVLEMVLELSLDTQVIDEVGARLKTVESVVAKLRAQQIALTEITDIGGVRVVFPSLIDIEQMHARIPAGQIARVKDYRASSTKRGYRALHLILRGDGERMIELQIRSQIHNIWANLSERLHQGTGYDIKHASGPDDLLQTLDDLSDFGRDIDELRAEVVQFGRWPWRRMEQVEIGAASANATANRRAAMMKRVLDERTERWNMLYDGLELFRRGVELLDEWEEPPR